MNYDTVVPWDVTLIDVWYTDIDNPLVKGLVKSAVKITTGIPTATAGKFIPGALIQNAVTGILYIMNGTTASPSWNVVDSLDTALDAGNDLKTSQNIIRGRLKLDVRPTGGTVEDYAYQIRANSAKTSGSFWGIDNESHLTASGTASVRSTQGVAVLDATFTNTGGSLTGVYGQARSDGTFNNAAGFVTGVYGLIEASAAMTASHVSAGWFDTHQVNAITGEYELLYMSNNGSLVLDQVMYIYGNSNALMNLDYGASTPAYITGPGSAANGTPIKLKLIHNGTPYFLNAYPTDNA